MASVLELSLTEEATVEKSCGHVRGPMLTAVCSEPPPPNAPCSHQVVTAGGAHLTLVSISSP